MHDNGYEEISETAEFVYHDSLKDYMVYAYDEDHNLVGTYEYKYDKNGDLSKVLINRNGPVKYQWDGSEFSYPGGELPDNFFYPE